MYDMSWSSAEERAKRQAEELTAIFAALLLGASFQDGWKGHGGKAWSTTGDPELYHTQHEAAIGYLEWIGEIEPSSEHRKAQIRCWKGVPRGI